MRKVRIGSSQFDVPRTVETDVTTWGELKVALEDADINTSDMAAMVKETRNSLEQDAALLPEGDFGVFLSPSKVKSGSLDSVSLEEVEAESFRVLRSHATSLGINAGSNPTKADLVGRITAYNLGRGNDSTDTTGVNPAEVEAAIQSLLEAVHDIRDVACDIIERVTPKAVVSDEDAEFMNDFRNTVG